MTQAPHLKIAIESMSRCAGACSGCMLADTERKGAAALGIDLDVIGHRAGVLTGDFLAKPDRKQDASAVHLTQGDHLLLDECGIDRLVSWARSFTHGELDLLVSTSAIGKTDIVETAVERFLSSSRLHSQELTLLVVFDPDKALNARFAETYRRNIDIILDAFGYIEPILNIGPDIPSRIAPDEIARFMERHGFDEIDLGLFPTRARAAEYAGAWPGLIAWFRDTLALSRRTGHFTMSFVALIDNVRRETAGLDLPAFTDWLAERLASQVYFDARGAMHPVLSGIFGNVLPLLPRFGFGFASALPQDRDICDWKSVCRSHARRIVSFYTRRPPCLACPHLKTCAGGGAILLERALEGSLSAVSECPIGIKPILDDLAADSAREMERP